VQETAFGQDEEDLQEGTEVREGQKTIAAKKHKKRKKT
jgi:hypothetical protein